MRRFGTLIADKNRDGGSVRNRLETMRAAIDSAKLGPDLKNTAHDALLAWTAGWTAEDWVERKQLTRGEQEYLREVGLWPWRGK